MRLSQIRPMRSHELPSSTKDLRCHCRHLPAYDAPQNAEKHVRWRRLDNSGLEPKANPVSNSMPTASLRRGQPGCLSCPIIMNRLCSQSQMNKNKKRACEPCSRRDTRHSDGDQPLSTGVSCENSGSARVTHWVHRT